MAPPVGDVLDLAQACRVVTFHQDVVFLNFTSSRPEWGVISVVEFKITIHSNQAKC
jgi:hypothetical protein